MQREGMRNSGRININVRGRYRNISYKTPSNWDECMILNLSKTGALIEGKYSFIPGDLIELAFSLETDTLFLHAEVVTTQSKNAGIQFTKLLKKDQEVIQNYVNSYMFKKH